MMKLRYVCLLAWKVFNYDYFYIVFLQEKWTWTFVKNPQLKIISFKVGLTPFFLKKWISPIEISDPKLCRIQINNLFVQNKAIIGKKTLTVRRTLPTEAYTGGGYGGSAPVWISELYGFQGGFGS